MPRQRRPARQRHGTELPSSLRRFLLEEITEDEAYRAQGELCSLPRPGPSNADGTWDGLDNFLLLGEFRNPHEFAVSLPPDVVHGLVADYALAHPGQRPRWWWDYFAPCEFLRYPDGTVEAQAAYLLRNKLLLPGEAKRLKTADYQPVPINSLEG